MDNITYESTSPVYKNLYENGGVGYCRGFAILTVFLYPVQYIPKTGELSYYPEMKITLNLRESFQPIHKNRDMFLRNQHMDQDFIRQMVVNPSVIATYSPSSVQFLGAEMRGTGNDTRASDEPFNGEEAPLGGYPGGLCNVSEQYQYVIITSASLKDATGYPYNWSSLIHHRKTVSGLNGTIVTVQDIDACAAYWNVTATFNDSQAHIREFCKDAFLDWGTEYIVLGGDWDGTPSHQIVPYRLFTDRYESDTYNTMACDMYYSHLDGNWYYADQSIWGGGRNSGVNDYYGELTVGRIAAYNASMVSNAVQKIIWYDLNASDDWLCTASFLGGDLGWTVTSKQYMEELRLGTDTYRTFTGFEEWNAAHPGTLIGTSERLYHADIGSNYLTYFSNSIQNDNASIINHLDHSNWDIPFGLTNWPGRHNTKPFFGYSQGCLAGRFQAGYAGCEQLLCHYPERNAFALVLNTGYGYGSASNTNGPSQYLQCYFWDYFFNNQSTHQNNWQLGKAHAYSEDIMSQLIDSSSHAWCYAWYSAHFFGDPAQRLRLKNAPVSNITIRDEQPGNGSSDVSLTLSNISVSINQSHGHAFSYTIQTVPLVGSCAAVNATNGTKSCAVSGLSYSTTYNWFVNVTDGDTWTNATYGFHTQAAPINNPPVMLNPSPSNGSNHISIGTLSVHIVIQDPESDLFNWTITTSPTIGTASAIGASNGTKYCNLTNLTYSTSYTWFVQAYDGHHWTNKTYLFTTENPPVNAAPIVAGPIPANGSINVSYATSVLSVSIQDPEGNLLNWTITTSPNVGTSSATGSVNGTQVCTVSGLWFSTTYTWYVRVTDGHSWTNKSYIFTTQANHPAGLSNASPANTSTGISLSTPQLSIVIKDSEGDFFNWTIVTNPPIGNNSGSHETNGTKSCTISGLIYSTTYQWMVFCKDSGSGQWSNASFWFITANPPSGPPSEAPPANVDQPTENHPPNSPQKPSGPAEIDPGVFYSYASSSVDPDGDPVRLSFNWGDGTVSNWTAFRDSNTTITSSHQWLMVGSYNVSVMAQDDHSDNSRSSEPLQVIVSEKTTINESSKTRFMIQGNLTANNTLVFNASDDYPLQGEIVSYYWDLGDGKNAIGKTFNHSYVHPGNYTVTLTVTDSFGQQYSESTVLMVGSSQLVHLKETSGSLSIVLIVGLLAGIIVLIVGLVVFIRRR
jgi:hypothetical protein